MNENFYLNKLKPFVGSKVIQLADNHNGYFGLVLEKDNKKNIIWFLSDDEGNNHGSFDIQPIK